MKPPGIQITLADGTIHMGLALSNRAIDQIWQAVEDAISHGMSPHAFKSEVEDAWEYHRKEQLKHELKELRR